MAPGTLSLVQGSIHMRKREWDLSNDTQWGLYTNQVLAHAPPPRIPAKK